MSAVSPEEVRDRAAAAIESFEETRSSVHSRAASEALDHAMRLVLDADRAGVRRERSLGALLSALADLDPESLLEATRDARGRLEL